MKYKNKETGEIITQSQFNAILYAKGWVGCQMGIKRYVDGKDQNWEYLTSLMAHKAALELENQYEEVKDA